jgi:hypothetical protein
VVSDGQTSIRRAVERALPGVPHQLCQFHFCQRRRNIGAPGGVKLRQPVAVA